jgi:hypothetical protein
VAAADEWLDRDNADGKCGSRVVIGRRGPAWPVPKRRQRWNSKLIRFRPDRFDLEPRFERPSSDWFELELDELLEFEFDELLEFELDELLELELDELLELEFDELFELEFDDPLELEFDELLPANCSNFSP